MTASSMWWNFGIEVRTSPSDPSPDRPGWSWDTARVVSPGMLDLTDRVALGGLSNTTILTDRNSVEPAQLRAGDGPSQPGDYPAVIDLGSLDGANGFRIGGVPSAHGFSIPVASAGDINADGFDDIFVGGPRAPSDGLKEAGLSYVVFGGPTSSGAHFNLGKLDGQNGFTIGGDVAHGLLGWAASSAGDVNGDGVSDFIVGAPRATDAHGGRTGDSYVVFGHPGDFAASLDVADLDGSNGFRLTGVHKGDDTGISVAAAGDVNGDGYADLIIGAEAASPGGHRWAGSSFLVFGKADGFDASFDLDTLDGTNGARLDGVMGGVAGSSAGQESGFAVASAGDINGDGFADFMIGSPFAMRDGTGHYEGLAYVLFGHAGAFDSMTLDGLNGANGFTIFGGLKDFLGARMASAGDVNGDGFGDIVLNNASAPSGGYVIFGHAGEFAAGLSVGALDGGDGFRIEDSAGEGAGASVSSAGDVNGDGFDDLLVGASSRGYAEGEGSLGSAYVVFGKAGGFSAVIDVLTLDGSNGFRIDGVAPDGSAGGSVALAGDVNGDGLGDLLIGASGANAAYVLYGQLPQQAVTRIGSAIGQSIHGGDFNDRLEGLGGDDILYGHAGKDTIVGGAGADTLYGGGGKDVFRYALAAESSSAAPDVIRDLRASDVINLAGVDADATQDANQAFHLVEAFGGHAGELVLSYDVDANKTVLGGDTDGDGVADFTILLSGDHHDFTGLVL